jgi:hypothetical protein
LRRAWARAGLSATALAIQQLAFLRLAVRSQGCAGVVQRRGDCSRMRSNLDGVIKLGHRFLVGSFPEQDEANGVCSDGIVGSQDQSRVGFTVCLLDLAGSRKNVGEVPRYEPEIVSCLQLLLSQRAPLGLNPCDFHFIYKRMAEALMAAAGESVNVAFASLQARLRNPHCSRGFGACVCTVFYVRDDWAQGPKKYRVRRRLRGKKRAAG